MIPKSILKSILVIENDHDTRVVLRELLESHGYSVFSATNGVEGLVELKKLPLPTIILLDQVMPLMGGEEFLKIKGKENGLAKIPVIMISSTPILFQSPDIVGFAPKPIDIDKLLRLLTDMV